MKRSFASLWTGVFCGFVFACIVIRIVDNQIRRTSITGTFQRKLWGIDSRTEDIDNNTSQENGKLYDRERNTVISTHAKRDVRILCFVLTHPDNHKTKAMWVKATWGKRFNKILFMSSVVDDDLPTVGLSLRGEARSYLWQKTKESFKYVYNRYNGTYDWVMKADDDTYVIVENLRSFLSGYDPSMLHYFGCLYKQRGRQGYMHGGAGYVLSREAVRRLVVDGLEKYNCGRVGAGEDLQMGRCMEKLGINTDDTRDELGRNRFLAQDLERTLHPYPRHPKLYHKKCLAYPEVQGLNCCSNTAVSFHYIPPKQMLVLDYLLYRVRPYGITRRTL